MLWISYNILCYSLKLSYLIFSILPCIDLTSPTMHKTWRESKYDRGDDVSPQSQLKCPSLCVPNLTLYPQRIYPAQYHCMSLRSDLSPCIWINLESPWQVWRGMSTIRNGIHADKNLINFVGELSTCLKWLKDDCKFNQ